MKGPTDPSQGDLFDASRHPRPHRKRGSPGPAHLEQDARDDALDRLSETRGGLIEIARTIAIQLAQQRKRITSVEVFAQMRAHGYDDALDSVDPRWMGPVFNEDIWVREGWEPTGSHKRPVAIWRLHDPSNVPPSPREKVYRAIGARQDDGATIEELTMATNLTASRIRSIIDDFLEADAIMPSGMRRRNRSRRKADVYVLPEHHPEIV